MFHIHKRKHFSMATELGTSRILMSIGFAILETVWSLYMYKLGLLESQIGLFTSFLIGVGFISALYATPCLEKMQAYRLFIVSTILLIVSILAISVFPVIWVFFILAVFVVIGRIFQWNSFQILFRDNSTKKDLAKNEGMLFSLLNLGWFIGPLVAGYVLSKSGIPGVFVASAVLLFMGLFIFLKLKIKHPTKKIALHTNVLANVKEFLSQKKVYSPFIMAAGTEYYWSMVYVFFPIYILKEFQNEYYIGFFLSAVIIPLILLEFSAGKTATKYGFRKTFFIAFFTLALISFGAYFIQSPVVLLGLFILASIPMAFTESLTDAFFFNRIKQKDEERLYPIFTTADNFGAIAGRLTLGLTIGYFSFNIAFLVLGAGMLLCAFSAYLTKK